MQVPVHCIYGTDVDTEVGYLYDVKRFTGEVPPAPHKIRQGPGDGTVNLRSLQSCRQLGPMVSPAHLLYTLLSGSLDALVPSAGPDGECR